jgi:O-methyltransferase
MLDLREEALDWAVKVGRRLPDPALTRLRAIYAKMGVVSLYTPDQPPPILLPPRLPAPDPDFVQVPAEGPTPLRVWPRSAPAGYLGQLDEGFQTEMAGWWAEVDLSDCHFYHRVRLRDGRVIDGPWNLLDGEEEYLGAVPVEGRRVLEFGPASGWLTAWLEQQGASVIAFDAGWDLNVDLMPVHGLDLDALRRDSLVQLCRLHNSWWYLHRDYSLTAKAVYGSIYNLPDDVGSFDISIFGSILLHLRDPFRALAEGAERTRDTIVVVEPLLPDLVNKGAIARWNPSRSLNTSAWWHHSPSLIVDMLRVLGFPDVTVTYHQKPYRVQPGNDPHRDSPLFTVVGRRE